ncbi:hypothetical protein BJ170DRAFT_130627 [Xylariales sp. AK1849]|nr:hypothetical protein BJ170DRAFT_130627 [Xylariales sp. AK1849]
MNRTGEDRRRIEAIRGEVKDYFTLKHKLHYIKSVGEGSHGATGLFIQKDPAYGPDGRKLVVKFSISPAEDGQLINEINALKLLQTEHMIKTVALAGDVDGGHDLDDDDEVEMGGTAGPAVDKTDKPHVPKKPERPTLILEYLEHGNLHEVRSRFAERRRPVPNRLLWRFTLCLVRAIIGLAYSKHLQPGERETIRHMERPSRLAHRSMKGLNVLVGNLVPGDGEHELCPILKLIDFGRTRILEGPCTHADRKGVSENMWGIGLIISALACPSYPLSPIVSFLPILPRMERWTMTDLTFERIKTDAHPVFIDNPDITLVLKNFICRCMANDAVNQPTLLEALLTCEEQVDAPPEQSFPNGVPANETDRAVAQIVQEIIFDGPPQADGPATLWGILSQLAL